MPQRHQWPSNSDKELGQRFVTNNWVEFHQRIVTKVQKPQKNQWPSNSDKKLSQISDIELG